MNRRHVGRGVVVLSATKDLHLKVKCRSFALLRTTTFRPYVERLTPNLYFTRTRIQKYRLVPAASVPARLAVRVPAAVAIVQPAASGVAES